MPGSRTRPPRKPPAKRPPAARRARHQRGDGRAAILATALELVRTHGAASFSLREAARIVGIDPAACYRHFRDRQDVLVAIAQGGFGELAAQVTASVAQRPPSETLERLLAIGHTYLAFALARTAEFRVMFGDSGHHARDQRLRPVGLRHSAYDLLEQAVAAHYPGVGAPALESVALALWSAVHGFTRLLLDGAIVLDRDAAFAQLDQLLRAVADGLATMHRPAGVTGPPG